jgi:hypothetical protein
VSQKDSKLNLIFFAGHSGPITCLESKFHKNPNDIQQRLRVQRPAPHGDHKGASHRGAYGSDLPYPINLVHQKRGNLLPKTTIQDLPLLTKDQLAFFFSRLLKVCLPARLTASNLGRHFSIHPNCFKFHRGSIL